MKVSFKDQTIVISTEALKNTELKLEQLEDSFFNYHDYIPENSMFHLYNSREYTELKELIEVIKIYLGVDIH